MDYLDREINYYKVQIAQEKRNNAAIDPMNLFTLQASGYFPNKPSNINLDSTGENLRNQYLDYGDYSLLNHESFKKGEDDGIGRAYNDHNNNSAFSHYFLPILMLEESYKDIGTRNKFLGKEGMFDLKYETKDLVFYRDYMNVNHIAIKGTSNASDLYSDGFILFRGGNTSAILGDVENQWIDLMNKYPDEKFNVYGHSLGASRSSILLDQFPDKINGVIAFNMGRSPLGMVGWNQKPNQKKLLHYKITGDPISNGVAYLESTNEVELKKLGPKYRGFADRIENYHKLKAFLNWNVTYGLENKMKHWNSTFGKQNGPVKFHKLFKLQDKSHHFAYKRRSANVQELEKKRGNIRGYSQDEIKRTLHNIEAYNLTFQSTNRDKLIRSAKNFGIPNYQNKSTDELRYLLYAYLSK